MDSISDCLNIESFQPIKAIGKGAFSDVILVKELSTGNKYAAKVLKKSIEDNTKEELISIFREIMINSKLDHPTIIKFIGLSPVDFNNNPKFTIITEYAPNGTLSTALRLESQGISLPGWNETKKLMIIYGIASGMLYLHDHNIIHRDLKPDNILLDDFFLPKVADFGLSKVKNENSKSQNYESQNQIKGTPAFLAPEMWNNGQFTKACDVYAFALVVFQVVTGEVPWEGLNLYQIIGNVLAHHMRPPIKDGVPQAYRSLIEKCWAQDPKCRPSFGEVLEMLRSDEGFITDVIDGCDFFRYVDYIDNYKGQMNSPLKTNIKSSDIEVPNELIEKVASKKSHETDYPQKQDLNVLGSSFFTKEAFEGLQSENKALVLQAENDCEKQFLVGRKLFEGSDDFPRDIELAITYLKLAIKNGNTNAAVFYSRALLASEEVPPNYKKAAKILSKFLYTKNSMVYTLFGRARKKEKDFTEAAKYFRKAADKGSGEAMCEYGKLLLKGKGVKKDVKQAFLFFQMSKKNNYTKSGKYISKIQGDDEVQFNFDDQSKTVRIEYNPQKVENNFRGIIWYLGHGNPKRTYNDSLIDILPSTKFTDKKWFLPENIVDFNNTENTLSDDCCFNSQDLPSSWICFDFKQIKISPEGYAIRTNSWNGKGWYHPLSWEVQASNDYRNWTVLDERKQMSEMDDSAVAKTFPVNGIQNDESFRYIRFVQTGLNSRRNNCLTLSAFEIFGTIIRP
ncbi:hypothetical protein M9Y10_006231 [Tritrichomonas musculus]|uniref:Protein kinase domain-containing protein n=1 Tax=Tritrichomonas musculus TaxID=1915356 RepID=A0ABR2JEM3_9EUKA